MSALSGFTIVVENPHGKLSREAVLHLLRIDSKWLSDRLC